VKKPWVKWLVATVLVAVPTFLLSPVLFPPAEGGPEPTAGQLPYFLLLGASDAILLALGVSFLLFGYPVLRKDRLVDIKSRHDPDDFFQSAQSVPQRSPTA
jgi:berberine-like enzyme